MKKSLLLAAVAGMALLAGQTAVADLAISMTGTPTLITFDTTLVGSNAGQFAGSGFENMPTAGRLDSNSWMVTGMDDGDTQWGGNHTTGISPTRPMA